MFSIRFRLWLLVYNLFSQASPLFFAEVLQTFSTSSKFLLKGFVSDFACRITLESNALILLHSFVTKKRFKQ